MKSFRSLFQGAAIVLWASSLFACGGVQYNIQGMAKGGGYSEGSVQVFYGSNACLSAPPKLSDTLNWSNSYSISNSSAPSVQMALSQMANGQSSAPTWEPDNNLWSNGCRYHLYRVWFQGALDRNSNVAVLTSLQAF